MKRPLDAAFESLRNSIWNERTLLQSLCLLHNCCKNHIRIKSPLTPFWSPFSLPDSEVPLDVSSFCCYSNQAIYPSLCLRVFAVSFWFTHRGPGASDNDCWKARLCEDTQATPTDKLVLDSHYTHCQPFSCLILKIIIETKSSYHIWSCVSIFYQQENNS